MPPPAGYPAIKLLQATLQFFRGLQSYPPRSSGASRRISLERIARHLLHSSLVLSQKPFLADVHFTRLSTSRTPFRVCVCLVGFEVLLCPRSRRGFHFPRTSANFLDAELLLLAAVFHRARIMGAVSFRFFSETASAEGLASSVSRFLFLDLITLLGGVAIIITDSISLSRSCFSYSCLPLLEP